MIFIGIDVGTQGVRGLAADECGRLLAGARREYRNVNLAPRIPEGWREQDPRDWWDAVCAVLEEMDQEIDVRKADTICVDGTSGTIAAIDEDGEPVCNALMYNDVRGGGGKGIPKIMWLKEHYAWGTAGGSHAAGGDAADSQDTDNAASGSGRRIHRFVHQADYIVGKLTGDYGITDWSNALKSGYDVRAGAWSPEARQAFSTDDDPDSETVPRVVPVGTPIGRWHDVTVVAGASDGYMSAVATCAVRPGEWASIIGTTLVLKGVTKSYISDPTGCVYCHKHPEGWWMPGGASNVGARCINEWFIPQGADSSTVLQTLNARIPVETPTGMLEYPLLVPGERFPFLDKSFGGFGGHTSYTAVIEGISYVERLCFEKLEELGCDVGDVIYATGGACRSDEWLQLRANILGRSIKVPEVTDAAIGGAMLGAAAVHYASLSEAADRMGRFAKIARPHISEAGRQKYDEIFDAFKAKIRETV